MTEKEFYEFYADDTWTTVCPECEKIVENKPHYRDAEDENDYLVCPICGTKLYVAE